MGIEISSGGVSKTFRYYPYDAFYVDANGNINANGDGEQVMEAYFNGTKYYPENPQDNVGVIRFFTDDFMSRDIPQRYFTLGDPDWVGYDAMLWDDYSRNEYEFNVNYNTSGEVTKVGFRDRFYYNLLNMEVELDDSDHRVETLMWKHNDSTSKDGTYNPSYHSEETYHKYVYRANYIYKYGRYGENGENCIQFMKESNPYFLDRTMSEFILSYSHNGHSPVWTDTLFDYRKPLEIYMYIKGATDNFTADKLIATYSYSDGFRTTSNYEGYSAVLGEIEPLFIETGLFDV
jgi:hypothetical protein